MNPAWACGTTLARSLVIAALSLLIACPTRALIPRIMERWAKRLVWVLLLAPFLTPSIVVGYTYANFALAQVRHPVVNQFLYLGLITMKLAPVAVLVLLFAPAPPLSAEAVHSHGLIHPWRWNRAGEWWTWLAIHVRGPMGNGAVAFAVVFLLAFQEFEIASLLSIHNWAVWVFDAQAGGLALSESLYYTAGPMVCQLIVLLPIVKMLLGTRRTGSRRAPEISPRGRLTPLVRRATWGYLALAAIAVSVVPATILFQTACTAFRGLFEDFPIGRQLVASLLFATGATLCAYLKAWALLSAPGPGPGNGRRGPIAKTIGGLALAALVGLTIIGLLGPLLISLSILQLFRLPVLLGLYDTPLPLLAGMTLILIAPAVLLVSLFRSVRSAEAAHAAGLLVRSPIRALRANGRRILWDINIQPQIWIAFLLFNWAFFDVTASKLLSPSNLTPTTVWLYDLMHYGRNAALSAMVCITVAIPVMLLLLIVCGKWLQSRLFRG